MELVAVFLTSDRHTLVTRRVAHVHTSELVDEEDDDGILYDSIFFFLHNGILTLATSSWAHQHVGEFIGVIEEGDNPESLRKLADDYVLRELAALKTISVS
jgi:hypothetical protein